jgi:hypothetical protein
MHRAHLSRGELAGDINDGGKLLGKELGPAAGEEDKLP